VKFFHEVKQYEQSMLNDLNKTEQLMQKKDVNPNNHSDTANELLLEMKVGPYVRSFTFRLYFYYFIH